MAKALTREQHERIRELKHLPYRDIAARAGCSIGMVSKVLASPGPTLPQERVPSPEVDRVLASVATLTAVDLSADDTYRDCIADLTRAGQIAAEAEDVARMVSVAKARAGVTKMREDAKPEEPPDDNKAPDMLEHAKRGRAWLHTLLGTTPEEP